MAGGRWMAGYTVFTVRRQSAIAKLVDMLFLENWLIVFINNELFQSLYYYFLGLFFILLHHFSYACMYTSLKEFFPLLFLQYSFTKV